MPEDEDASKRVPGSRPDEVKQKERDQKEAVAMIGDRVPGGLNLRLIPQLSARDRFRPVDEEPRTDSANQAQPPTPKESI